MHSLSRREMLKHLRAGRFPTAKTSLLKFANKPLLHPAKLQNAIAVRPL